MYIAPSCAGKRSSTARCIHPVCTARKSSRASDHPRRRPPRQERINERVAEEHLRWLINCNYRYGDYHMVLHYWDKEITLEQAERDRAAFLRELRKAYAKAGKRLKYIAVLETKHMTNVHHHILLPRFDAQIIAAAWTKVTNGAGSISFQMLDDRKNHAKLASYLIKESRSTMRRCRGRASAAGGIPAAPAWPSRRPAIR